MTGRSQAGLDSAQEEIGKDTIVFSSDARSLTDLDALADRVKVEFGTLDLLFVNAGFSLFAPSTKLPRRPSTRCSTTELKITCYDRLNSPPR